MESSRMTCSFMRNSTTHLKNYQQFKLFQKTEKEILPNLFCEASTTLIKAFKDIRKLEANIPDEHKCKNIQKMLARQPMTHEKNYLLWSKWYLFLGCEFV